MATSKGKGAVAPQAAGPVITVLPTKTVFSGARAAWYAHLCSHNGQTVAAFTAAALATPPSTPGKGKLAGKCEPPAGWLRFFAKHGYCTVGALPTVQPPST